MTINRCIFICLLLFAGHCFAGTVDTVSIYSNSMKKNISCVVIKPDSYKRNKNRYPAVYLLHGFNGNYSNWIKKVATIQQYVDTYQMLIVCPDGAISSWYLDSPVDPAMRYETHVGVEVPEYIDAHYRTIANRNGRAITGLSMGGHGGLFIGLRHSDTFGACGSMSGGVNLAPSYKSYDIAKRVGDTAAASPLLVQYSVSTIIEKQPAQPVSIIIDCGTEDFFYHINQQLHEKMLRLKIPHDYIERPGKHNWQYWANAVQYQLLYFNNYFKQTVSKE
jgi:S-formylglutathione hydrolase FrmB